MLFLDHRGGHAGRLPAGQGIAGLPNRRGRSRRRGPRRALGGGRRFPHRPPSPRAQPGRHAPDDRPPLRIRRRDAFGLGELDRQERRGLLRHHVLPRALPVRSDLRGRRGARRGHRGVPVRPQDPNPPRERTLRLKTKVIVNPESNQGRTRRRWAEIKEGLRHFVKEFRYDFTEKPFEAIELDPGRHQGRLGAHHRGRRRRDHARDRQRLLRGHADHQPRDQPGHRARGDGLRPDQEPEHPVRGSRTPSRSSPKLPRPGSTSAG